MKETWIDISGYEGLYKVSNKGRVKSVARTKKSKSKTGKWFKVNVRERILKQFTCNSGYFKVVLSKGGVVKNHMTHRLVALAHITNRFSYDEVTHVNGDKLDNFVSNLELVTGSINKSHSYKIGLRKTGKEHHFSKMTRDENGYCRQSNLS